MAFQEVHASQFTSPTTPYTGCRHVDGFFATEGHSFHFSTNTDNSFIMTPSSLPPPRDGKCVGHDQCGDWQLFAYLDPYHDTEDEQQQQQQQQQQNEQNVSETSEGHRRVASMSSLPDAIVVDTPTRDTGVAIAWLVLQSRNQQHHTFTASFNYRPLSPMLTISACNSESQSEHDHIVVAWVGSADDSKLRCYSTDDRNRHVLKQVELTDEAFLFDSPVMVMDSMTIDNSRHLVAVGCQDGTVRAIFLDYDKRGDSVSFKEITAYTILVDGPIMALHLSHQQNDEIIHLVVGSMCGFVCQLLKSLKENSNWQGPFMVTEGLRNERLDSEDSVLAVDIVSNDMVSLGTHAGKCMVWQKRQEESSYRLLWECKLPYSIHGLSHVVNAGSKDTPTILVTTRFTFHVFQRDVPKYCPDTAKRRLQEMIAERQTAVELLKIA